MKHVQSKQQKHQTTLMTSSDQWRRSSVYIVNFEHI